MEEFLLSFDNYLKIDRAVPCLAVLGWRFIGRDTHGEGTA
jgi:hypothetical protein